MTKARTTIVVAAAVSALSLAACSGGSGNAGGDRRSIATGGSGGVFYVLGAGIANIVSQEDASYELQAQATAATEENLRLIQSGEVDLAFSVYDAAVDAYNGEGDYPQKYDKVRLVMPGHNGYYHVLTRSDSGIEEFEDMKGKRIGVSPGYIGEKLGMGMVEPHGLLKTDVNLTALSFTEMADGLRNSTLDVATITAGMPASSVVELKTSLDVNFISQSPEDQAAIVENHPYWIPATIDKSVYETDEDILTFAAPYVIVANADVPDEVIREFVEIVYSDNERLVAVHAEGANYTVDHPLFENDLLIPLHPGAEEYLSDAGVLNG